MKTMKEFDAFTSDFADLLVKHNLNLTYELRDKFIAPMIGALIILNVPMEEIVERAENYEQTVPKKNVIKGVNTLQ